MEEDSKKWTLIDYLRVIPAFIVAGIIFYFSSLSDPLPAGPPGPPTIWDFLDKNTVLHICEYGLLAILVAFGFIDKTKINYLAIATIIFAFSDEVHQYFVPNRYFDVLDVLADTIGVILGFLAYLILEKLIKSQNRNTTKNI